MNLYIFIHSPSSTPLTGIFPATWTMAWRLPMVQCRLRSVKVSLMALSFLREELPYIKYQRLITPRNDIQRGII